MSPEDRRLVAALIMFGDRLPAIVEEVLAGTFDQVERREFAVVVATILAELAPVDDLALLDGSRAGDGS